MIIVGIIIVVVMAIMLVLLLWLENIWVLILGTILAIVSSVGTGIWLSSHIPEEMQSLNRQDIVAVRDVTRTSGNVFVFGSDEYFSYYAQNEDGSYSLKKKLASDAVIVEEDRTDGEVYEVWKVKNNSNLGWVYVGLDSASFYRSEFHIPRGSIVRQFVLDAQ